MLRQSISLSYLILPLLLSAAPSGVKNTLAHLPLRFETAADGTLISRQGQFALAVKPGQTTVTVADRAHHKAASVTAQLKGANRQSRPVGEDPLAAKASYFLGSDPANWRSGATLFTRAVEHDVYRGVDLVFHGDAGALEYDFVVHPGADTRQIAFDISGASAVRVDFDGALAIATEAGEIRWKKPEVYQWKNGARQTVAGAFALHGQRVTFSLGAYDRGSDLVIDPTLAYGTYLGGNDNEGARGVAVDASGNIYVAGFTFSMNFPVTSGALQTAWHGGNYYGDIGGDAFVAKYTSAGALSYLTYLGGSADDSATAIAVDGSGNAYVTGFAASTNFPTTSGAFQKTFGGAGIGAYYIPFGDAFVAKLNPTGSALVYSTFLGGKDDDEGTGIAVDTAGNAYIVGATLSSNFPTASPYQPTYGGFGGSPQLCSGCNGSFITFGDAFVTKLNAAGSAVVFSTFLGGSLDDTATSVAVDGSGNVYVGGSTVSTNFPTLNGFQTKSAGAANGNSQPVITIGDGFVAKFDGTGKLQYSSYLGGNADDAVMGVAVDSTGAAYVTGFTSSPNFPVTASAAQKSFGGPAGVTGDRGFVWGDAFVAKVASNGGSLAWATYLGGNQDDSGMAIALDAGGNVIVGGFSSSTNLAVTSNAQQKTFAGDGSGGTFTDPTGDGFLAQLSADGSTLKYLSYYGGNSSDAITSVAVDGQANIIVAGASTSTNLPVTSSAAQKAFGGQSSDTPTETMGDAFMAIFSGVAATGGTTGTPTITAIVNAASSQGGFAPGSLVMISGANLPAASTGATVGSQAASVVTATSTSWTVAIPYTATIGSTTIQIGSASFPITLAQYAPALFVGDASQNIVQAQRVLSGSTPAVTAAAPAFPGDTVNIFATGLGAIDSGGHPSPLAAVTVGPNQVSVFNVVAQTSNPGTYVVTIQVPPSTTAGNQAIVLSIGGKTSQSLVVPIGTITGLTISNVENGASYLPGFSQGSWTTITGGNLSGSTRIWAGSDFNGTALPTQLDQVSVTIDNKPAFVYFISPTQINVLAPADATTGPVPVQVTYNGQKSNIVSASESSFSPALFMFSPQGSKYVAAVRYPDGQYIGPTSLYTGLTIPAKAGDIIELYGTGFGPTNPPTDFSQTFGGAPATVNTVTATIGGVPATVGFAGLVAPGEYQFNITVPTVPSGDNLIVLKVNGIITQANAYLTVQ
jgi:uncharacterized protein (TIGR03437 family)